MLFAEHSPVGSAISLRLEFHRYLRAQPGREKKKETGAGQGLGREKEEVQGEQGGGRGQAHRRLGATGCVNPSVHS